MHSYYETRVAALQERYGRLHTRMVAAVERLPGGWRWSVVDAWYAWARAQGMGGWLYL